MCASTSPTTRCARAARSANAIAVGLDIEWEVGADGPPAGIVHGDVLVGRARHAIDGPGWFYDDGDAGSRLGRG